VAKPEAKSQPERPVRRWEDIKMNLKEAEMEGEEWIYLAQKCNKLACGYECGNEISAFIK